MKRSCPDCGTYDDALCSTVCPHERFISDEIAAQKDAAIKLLGKDVAFAHMPTEKHRIGAVSYDGMVALDDLPGWFAPHLFVEFKEAR